MKIRMLRAPPPGDTNRGGKPLLHSRSQKQCPTRCCIRGAEVPPDVKYHRATVDLAAHYIRISFEKPLQHKSFQEFTNPWKSISSSLRLSSIKQNGIHHPIQTTINTHNENSKKEEFCRRYAPFFHFYTLFQLFLISLHLEFHWL
jgi:hypothetical protein